MRPGRQDSLIFHSQEKKKTFKNDPDVEVNGDFYEDPTYISERKDTLSLP